MLTDYWHTLIPKQTGVTLNGCWRRENHADLAVRTPNTSVATHWVQSSETRADLGRVVSSAAFLTSTRTRVSNRTCLWKTVVVAGSGKRPHSGNAGWVGVCQYVCAIIVCTPCCVIKSRRRRAFAIWLLSAVRET